MTHVGILLAIAQLLTACDGVRVLARLDDAGRRLRCGALGDDQAVLRLQGGLCDGLGLRRSATDAEGMLIGHALSSGRAHPLVSAALGHDLGRRAGLVTDVAFAAGTWWTLVERGPSPVLLNVDGAFRPDPGEWAVLCPHRTAHAALAHLARSGPFAWGAALARFARDERLPLPDEPWPRRVGCSCG